MSGTTGPGDSRSAWHEAAGAEFIPENGGGAVVEVEEDRMTFRVETYFVGEDGLEHLWRDPTTIATLEFEGYAAAARDIVEGLLEDGQTDGPHPIGLRITDPTGKLVFNYVRPSPSQGVRQGEAVDLEA